MTHLLINLLGGIGLILLGMKLMSNGLKLVAGKALRTVLSDWTSTPLKGVASGFMITSAVQSSSAVTVATIGFVNAGLLTLGQAMWVVYGTNIGTTTTAWIVAFLGLKINVKLLALPCIAAGMGLWITGAGTRRAAAGEALAGFGLFFLGIEAMQAAFQGGGDSAFIQNIANFGIFGHLAFIGVGFLLTFLMQSSSGAMALILSAVAGGVVPLSAAAAGVVGANVGTTTTAALAVIGATPNAKRVAAGHVIFNIMAGIVALLLLPGILWGIHLFRSWFELAPDPAPVLAVFHTIFNLIGVALIWKMTPMLTRFLEKKFRTTEEDESRPKFLDANVVSTPSLALNALALEVQRTGAIAERMSLAALGKNSRSRSALDSDQIILGNLLREIGAFSTTIRKSGFSQESSELFPEILRAAQYFNVTAEKALAAASIRPAFHLDQEDGPGSDLKKFEARAADLITSAVSPLSEERFQIEVQEIQHHYQDLKRSLLQAGGHGEISMERTIELLDYANHLESMVKQILKGRRTMTSLKARLEIPDGQESPGNTAPA